ncbi:MAG: lipocalin family protein [Bacteroidales bacterium]|nr:lipocalin family protein [Bacteroidales bacterium]
MKKALLAIAAVACVALAGCTKDETASPYADDIIGTWSFTEVQINGSWINITSPLYAKYQTSATFYSDGTYYGTGYFGTGYGTYKLKNDILVCYVDGDEYMRYQILSLSNGFAEMIMTMGSSSMNIRCTKQ